MTIPFMGKNVRMTFPEKDTAIGRKLRTGEMWEGLTIRQKLVPNFPANTTFVDCGAFIGTHSCCMAMQNPTGDVHSFEMMPEIHELLGQNISDNGLTNVTTYLQPLSDGERVITRPNRDYDKPDNYGFTMIGHRGDTSVTTKSLDSYISNFKKPVSVIKIDVEGHEMEVLMGARKTIAQHRPFMLVEVWKRNLETFQESFMWHFLKGLGYTYYQYYDNLVFEPSLNEISRPILDRNTVFYFGIGKTGSASIYHGFSDKGTVCHYHGSQYFNWVTGADTKDDTEVLKLISGIGYMLGFRPRVIECVREPKSRAISALFHEWFNLGKDIDELLQKPDHELKSMLQKFLEEKPVHETVKVPDNIEYIVLDLKDKAQWREKLLEYGLDWTPIDSNVNNHPCYKVFKDRALALIEK